MVTIIGRVYFFDKNLSSFIHDNLRIRAIASILTHKQVGIVGNQTIASVTVRLLKLITQIYFCIIQQFCFLATRKGIFQIYICSA